MGIFWGLGVPRDRVGVLMGGQPGQEHKWRPPPPKLFLLCSTPRKGAHDMGLDVLTHHSRSIVLPLLLHPPKQPPWGPGVLVHPS